MTKFIFNLLFFLLATSSIKNTTFYVKVLLKKITPTNTILILNNKKLELNFNSLKNKKIKLNLDLNKNNIKKLNRFIHFFIHKNKHSITTFHKKNKNLFIKKENLEILTKFITEQLKNFKDFLIIKSKYSKCSKKIINQINKSFKISIKNIESELNNYFKKELTNQTLIKNKTKNKLKKITLKNLNTILMLVFYKFCNSIHFYYLSKLIELEPQFTSYNNNNYCGIFYLKKINKNSEFLLINKVEVNDYLNSVVRFESWPNWPEKVNKLMAIISRTYLFSKITEAKKLNLEYHIKDNIQHQTYKGTHSDKKIKNAIEKTKNKILVFNNKPITALYDSCCGGIIPGKSEVCDFIKFPYLKRNKRCIYCKKFKLYNWSFKLHKKELATVLKNFSPNLKNINRIKLIKDNAELIKNIIVFYTDLNSKKTSLKLTNNKCYGLLKNIKSYCFDIKKNKQNFYFKGRGYGHHLGCCQWGAKEMIERGFKIKEILQFYYPGAKLLEYDIANLY